MSETVSFIDWDIQQGADYNPPDLIRQFYLRQVRRSACGFIDVCSGKAVKDSDLSSEDYTGCTAVMKLRQRDASGVLLLELSTSTGEIELEGNTIRRHIGAAVTSLFPVGPVFGQIDITRQNGQIERQYVITCSVVANGNTL